MAKFAAGAAELLATLLLGKLLGAALEGITLEDGTKLEDGARLEEGARLDDITELGATDATLDDAGATDEDSITTELLDGAAEELEPPFGPIQAEINKELVPITARRQ